MIKLLKHPWIFLIIAFVITVSVKIPHLTLPYFFDETFSYHRAIQEMAKGTPGLLPGNIPLDLSKGHPLFFYFLGALWLKFIAGNSIPVMRIFPLLIALLALFVFHRFAKRHTNIILANVGVVILSLQSLFLAQASLVLPEILLFTLVMLCFDSYLSGNYGWYALFGSLMMMTKETGAVFIMVFGLSYLAENFRHLKTRKFWTNLFFMGIPVFVYILFIILHDLKLGYFFYPEHLGYITINPEKVRYKFQSSTWMLFLAQGRNLIFFASIIALIILLIRKQSLKFKRFLILSLSVLVAFLTFSILNFYVYRYIFPVLGISLLASLVLIQQIKLKYQWVNIAFIISVLTLSAYKTATQYGQSDADLGYVQYLVVQHEMIRYCEDQAWYDKEIGSGFNMVMSMRDRWGRCLSTDRNFKMHHLPGTENRDIIMYDSTCWPYEMPESDKKGLTLIKHFQHKQHWGDIYRVNKTDTLTINR